MHEHAAHATADNPFTPSEVQEFHTSDKRRRGERSDDRHLPDRSAHGVIAYIVAMG
ncbi:MAG: hypothetical protein U0736_26660 [Gemmataceae bacterium]